MPIDPNIILGIKPAQIQQQDPLEQYGKSLTLKNLMLQNQQGEQANQDEEAQRAALISSGGDNKRYRELLAGRGQYKAVQTIDRLALENEGKRATIDKDKAETLTKAVAVHRDQLANIDSPQAAAQWVASGFNDPTLSPILSRGGDLQTALSRIPQDPQKFAEWKQQNALGATKFIEMNKPNVMTQNLGGSSNIVSTPGLGGAPTTLSSTPTTMTPGETANLGVAKSRLGIEGARYAFDTGQPPPGAPAAPGTPPGPGGAVAQPVPMGTPGLSPKANQEVSLAFQKKRAENAGEYDKSLNERVAQGADLNMRLQETNQALQDFKTGGGKETRVKLAQMAQAVPGVPPAIVNGIAGGDIAAAQEFEKLQISSAMEQLRLAMGGTGRITQSEFAAFRQANPNLNLDPNAIKKISDFTTKIYRLSREEQQAFGKWQADGKNPADFRTNWDQQLEAKGVTQPNLVSAPLGAKANEKPVPIKGDDGFNALASGTLFVGPDGKTRRKP